MTDALIHLRVPAELKARWVRESRAAGMRLTDWIVQRVEQQMKEKYYVWECPGGWIAAGTAATLGEGEPPWAFQGYSYIGCTLASSAEDARAMVGEPSSGRA